MLQVRTYDVVPVTPSLGMVAFVAGTQPLKGLLTNPALLPPEAIAAADEKYHRFIMAKGGNLERAGAHTLLLLPSRLSTCTQTCTHSYLLADTW